MNGTIQGNKEVRAATVCVDYSKYLAISLPYNRHHFKEWLIVTDHADKATQQLAEEYECTIYLTNAFYEQGAYFNKWLALEEGLDAFGRHGIMVMLDADTLWPRRLPNWIPELDILYTPVRHLYPHCHLLPENAWGTCPLHPNMHDWAGYTQIFHATDSHLPTPPWHQTFWKHAGGADTFFQSLWPEQAKKRPPFSVLHMGTPGQDWCGTSSEGRSTLRDLMRKRNYKLPEETRYNHEYL